MDSFASFSFRELGNTIIFEKLTFFAANLLLVLSLGLKSSDHLLVEKNGRKLVEIAVGWRATLQFHALHFSLTVNVPKKKLLRELSSVSW